MSTPEILIVEDEAIVAMEISKRVKQFGYSVCGVAVSGEEAIEQAELRRPDIVLMDIRLDGEMDGIEAAGIIRERFNIPVVYVTAHADKDILQRAKLTDPFGYVVKPIQEIELRGTIEIALYKYKMEQKLLESERWLSTTLKSIGDAVIATDAEGNITFLNPIAEAMTGWQWDDALGRQLTEVFPIVNEESRATVENPVTRVLREGHTVDLANHTLLLSKDGTEIPIDDSAAPIKDNSGNVIGVILVFHDITQRREAERSVKKYTLELEARNEELNALTYTLAHSFKNMLNTINWSVSVLESGFFTMSANKSQSHLNDLSRATHKMIGLVDELLMLSETRSAEIQQIPLDMASIVGSARRRVGHIAIIHQAEISAPATWPAALGHAKWIEEVWFNYISNAIEYGGKPPHVELGATPQPDGMIRFWVRDNGLGIPPGGRNKVFTPHVRLDKGGIEEHGLGLLLVRRIVEKLGGEAGMTDAEDRGSVFFFTLPSANNDTSQTSP